MWSSTPPIDGRKKSLSIKTQCFRRATTGDDADVDGASSASFGARRARVMAPFLGGMRGLTVFVQDVRNCSNKVRARAEGEGAATARARE